MGFLFQKIQDAQTTRHERDTINKVVRVLSKSMDLWISLYQDYGTPPTVDECVTLEDTRISELMAEYRPKVAQALGRVITVPDLLVDNREAELATALRERKGQLCLKFSGVVKQLEVQAAEQLGKAVAELAAKVEEVKGMFPTKQTVIEQEFQELLNELTQDIEARFPDGISGLTKYDDILPEGIPTWETFLGQVEAQKSNVIEENAIAVLEQIATMKKSAEEVMKEKINASIRAAIDEIKADLSDDVISFLDDGDRDALCKELMEITESYGMSRLS
jgi:hypothetical protein